MCIRDSVIWVAVAFLWYLAYARKHSALGLHKHVGLLEEEPKE